VVLVKDAGFGCNYCFVLRWASHAIRDKQDVITPYCPTYLYSTGRLGVLVFLLTEYLTTYRLFDITPHIMVFVELAAMPRVVSMKETLLRRIIFCQSK
jgi:hypothetical protein